MASLLRSEISGYLQIVIGAVGIIVTVLTAPDLLGAIGQVADPADLPPEFSGTSSFIRIMVVLFVLLTFSLLIVLGLALVTGGLAEKLGARRPFLTSLFTVLSLVCLSVSATFALLEIRFWVAAFVAAFFLITMVFAAAGGEDDTPLEVLSVIGAVGFLMVGLFSLADPLTALERAQLKEAGPPDSPPPNLRNGERKSSSN